VFTDTALEVMHGHAQLRRLFEQAKASKSLLSVPRLPPCLKNDHSVLNQWAFPDAGKLQEPNTTEEVKRLNTGLQIRLQHHPSPARGWHFSLQNFVSEMKFGLPFEMPTLTKIKSSLPATEYNNRLLRLCPVDENSFCRLPVSVVSL